MFLRRHDDQVAPPPREYGGIELDTEVTDSPSHSPVLGDSPKGEEQQGSRNEDSHQDDFDFLRSHFNNSSSTNNSLSNNNNNNNNNNE